MARIRTIKPDFWEDEHVSVLHRDARLLFICCWNLADDEGLLRWTPEYLKAEAFRYDTDVSVKKMAALMAELVEGRFVFTYKAGRSQQALGYIVKFRKHQKINRPQPAKLPPPSIQNLEVRRMYARRDDWTCGLCHLAIPELTARAASYDPTDLPSPDLALSMDHIVPVSKGGSDYPTNLRATHVSCNKARKDRDDPFITVDVNSSLNDSLNGSPPTHGTFHAGSLPEGKGRERKGKGSSAAGAGSLNEPRSATRRTPDPVPLNADVELRRLQAEAAAAECGKCEHGWLTDDHDNVTRCACQRVAS